MSLKISKRTPGGYHWLEMVWEEACVQNIEELFIGYIYGQRWLIYEIVKGRALVIHLARDGL